MTLANKRKLIGVGFISPWLIGFVLFFSIPVIQTLVFSFHTVTITPEGYTLQSEGLRNYIFAFRSDAEFPKILLSSMLNLLMDVPFVIIFSFFISVVLNKPFRGSGLVKAIFFLTVILSSSVFQSLNSQTDGLNSGQLSSALQDNSTLSGLLNSLSIEEYLVEMGIPETFSKMLTTPMMSLFSILSSSGIQIFIFLAALKTIPPSLYESSYIEGANAWETFWKITFPMVMPMVLVNVVYTVIDTFLRADNEALKYVQKMIFKNMKFGYGNALAWIYFSILSVILGVTAFLISRKTFYYDK